MRRRLALGVAMGLGVLAAPGGALGATAQVSGDSVVFNAAAAETNHLVITQSGANFVIDDPTIPIAPTAPCAMVDADTVTCPVAAIETIEVDLGDNDDSATIDPSVTLPDEGNFFQPPILIEGGAGGDELTGSPTLGNGLFGHSSFTDGAGDDQLTGGAGSDRLQGQEGNDTITAGGGDFDAIIPGFGNDTVLGEAGTDAIFMESAPDGADDLSGGIGPSDQVSYQSIFGDQRTGDLSIDTDDVADDGEAGEGDNVRSDIEAIGAGTGDDTVTTGPGDQGIQGNDGNDTITTGAGDDSLFGGTGNDTLDAGDGDDQLGGALGIDSMLAGAGNDRLSEGGFDDDPDLLSGGPGVDLLDRGAANAPLTITLDGVANDGEPGEGDNAMADIENVLGGNKNDLIEGTGAANELVGNGGVDTLIGNGGEDGLTGGFVEYSGGGGGGFGFVDGGDTLIGGGGIDTLEGGTGADVLRSRDKGADEISCGSSVDTVFADSFDDPAAACDLVSRGVQIKSKSAKAEDGEVPVKASCPAIETGGCTARFVLKATAKAGSAKKETIIVAKGKKTIKAGKQSTANLKLTDDGQKLLKGRGLVGTTATAKMTDANGDKVTSSRKLKLS